jgi:large subunit ribosomal protein L21
MFAVIRTGGKQYRVAENDRITVEKLAGDAGSTVALADVLMIGGDGAPPLTGAALAGAKVFAEVVAQGRGKKILVFKKKRRKNHRRLNGHRQRQTVLRIDAISATGEPPAARTATEVKAEAPAPATAAATVSEE